MKNKHTTKIKTFFIRAIHGVASSVKWTWKHMHSASKHGSKHVSKYMELSHEDLHRVNRKIGYVLFSFSIVLIILSLVFNSIFGFYKKVDYTYVKEKTNVLGAEASAPWTSLSELKKKFPITPFKKNTIIDKKLEVMKEGFLPGLPNAPKTAKENFCYSNIQTSDEKIPASLGIDSMKLGKIENRFEYYHDDFSVEVEESQVIFTLLNNDSDLAFNFSKNTYNDPFYIVPSKFNLNSETKEQIVEFTLTKPDDNDEENGEGSDGQNSNETGETDDDSGNINGESLVNLSHDPSATYNEDWADEVALEEEVIESKSTVDDPYKNAPYAYTLDINPLGESIYMSLSPAPIFFDQYDDGVIATIATSPIEDGGMGIPKSVFYAIWSIKEKNLDANMTKVITDLQNNPLPVNIEDSKKHIREYLNAQGDVCMTDISEIETANAKKLEDLRGLIKKIQDQKNLQNVENTQKGTGKNNETFMKDPVVGLAVTVPGIQMIQQAIMNEGSTMTGITKCLIYAIEKTTQVITDYDQEPPTKCPVLDMVPNIPKVKEFTKAFESMLNPNAMYLHTKGSAEDRKSLKGFLKKSVGGNIKLITDALISGLAADPQYIADATINRAIQKYIVPPLEDCVDFLAEGSLKNPCVAPEIPDDIDDELEDEINEGKDEIMEEIEYQSILNQLDQMNDEFMQMIINKSIDDYSVTTDQVRDILRANDALFEIPKIEFDPLQPLTPPFAYIKEETIEKYQPLLDLIINTERPQEAVDAILNDNSLLFPIKMLKATTLKVSTKIPTHILIETLKSIEPFGTIITPILTENIIEINEGESHQIGVALSDRPNEDITISFASSGSQVSVTFTPNDWENKKVVEIQAGALEEGFDEMSDIVEIQAAEIYPEYTIIQDTLQVTVKKKESSSSSSSSCDPENENCELLFNPQNTLVKINTKNEFTLAHVLGIQDANAQVGINDNNEDIGNIKPKSSSSSAKTSSSIINSTSEKSSSEGNQFGDINSSKSSEQSSSTESSILDPFASSSSENNELGGTSSSSEKSIDSSSSESSVNNPFSSSSSSSSSVENSSVSTNSSSEISSNSSSSASQMDILENVTQYMVEDIEDNVVKQLMTIITTTLSNNPKDHGSNYKYLMTISISPITRETPSHIEFIRAIITKPAEEHTPTEKTLILFLGQIGKGEFDLGDGLMSSLITNPFE